METKKASKAAEEEGADLANEACCACTHPQLRETHPCATTPFAPPLGRLAVSTAVRVHVRVVWIASPSVRLS